MGSCKSYCCKQELAALKAENERLTKERDAQYDENITRTASEGAAIIRAEAAERALAERAGGVRFVGNIPGSSSASGFAPLTTEPAAPETRACTCHPDDNPPDPCAQKFAYSDCVAAAPEGRQDDEPAALRQWREDQLERVRDGSFLTRPAEQAVTEAARRVLEWVYPIAGDNRDEAQAKEEIESVEALKAAMEAGRHD